LDGSTPVADCTVPPGAHRNVATPYRDPAELWTCAQPELAGALELTAAAVRNPTDPGGIDMGNDEAVYV